MTKILLAIHGLESIDTYKSMVELAGSKHITPVVNKSLDSLIAALDQKPDKVIMDVNYGRPNTDDLEPFLRVARKMKELGYDTKDTLLGISGRDYFIEDSRKKYPEYSFFIKGTDSTSNLINFFM